MVSWKALFVGIVVALAGILVIVAMQSIEAQTPKDTSSVSGPWTVIGAIAVVLGAVLIFLGWRD